MKIEHQWHIKPFIETDCWAKRHQAKQNNTKKKLNIHPKTKIFSSCTNAFSMQAATETGAFDRGCIG